jgi:hypothetical protein
MLKSGVSVRRVPPPGRTVAGWPPTSASPRYTCGTTPAGRCRRAAALSELLETLAEQWPAPAHHLDLLNHPLVYQALRDWLGDGGVGRRGP